MFRLRTTESGYGAYTFHHSAIGDNGLFDTIGEEYDNARQADEADVTDITPMDSRPEVITETVAHQLGSLITKAKDCVESTIGADHI